MAEGQIGSECVKMGGADPRVWGGGDGRQGVRAFLLGGALVLVLLTTECP